MAAGTPFQIFYDRADIYLDGVRYLPLGQIRNMTVRARYKSSLQFGYTPDGNAAGIIIGSSSIDAITWTEYLTDATQIINWRTFLIGAPYSGLQIIPISLALDVPSAPSFAITGIICTGQDVVNGTESEPFVRDISLAAIKSSNL